MTREESLKQLKDLLDYCKSSGEEWAKDAETLDMAIKALEQEPCEDAISRQAATDKLKKLVDEMETIFSDIREKLVDDSVCGLCEYDCDHGIDGCANECPGFERDDCFRLKDKYRKEWMDLSNIPSVTCSEEQNRCKDCKHFEYDSVAKIDGIPLIVAHEICNRWGDGCKTNEDGYCFLFEPKAESEDKE